MENQETKAEQAENQGHGFEHLIEQIAKKEKQTFKISLLLSFLLLIVGTGYLVYSFWQVNELREDLRREMASKDAEIQRKNDELSNTQTKLDEAKKAFTTLYPMLQKYIVVDITAENLESPLVIRSLEAQQEIQKISSDGEQRRRAITVQYFKKTTDNGKVETALKEFGFNLKVSPPIRKDLPTNLVAFGKKVTVEDARTVVYVLMRAGIEIKGLCKGSFASNALVIQALGDAALLSSQPLSVAQVKEQTAFRQCRSR
ncbi:MAG TPA: hypothetical protein VGO50_06655 [Pyrinomonadaceae bacterium]|jgi:hypothetical protein|nr:hypothetical protein [Pyrinomonadaceae bacterium]